MSFMSNKKKKMDPQIWLYNNEVELSWTLKLVMVYGVLHNFH